MSKPTVLILGGQSPRHHGWVRNLAAHIEAAGYDDVRIHDYAHWLRDEPLIDLESELAAVSELDVPQDCVVVAKSIGTVVALLAMSQGLLQASRCVFMGFPLQSWFDNPAVAGAWSSLSSTVLLQNEYDPLGSAADVMTYLTDIPGAPQLVTLPGDTHDYVDYAVIIDAINPS